MVIVDTPTLITGMSMGFLIDYYLETGDWRFLAVCAGLLISLVAINIWENKRRAKEATGGRL